MHKIYKKSKMWFKKIIKNSKID